MKKIFYMIVFLMLGTLGNLSAQITLFKGTFDEALKKAQQEKKNLFVDFFAEWCGPCKAMKPILEEVKSKVGDTARIVKIDVDQHEQLAARFKIQAVPTFILFSNGESVWRHSGMIHASELTGVIEQYSHKN